MKKTLLWKEKVSSQRPFLCGLSIEQLVGGDTYSIHMKPHGFDFGIYMS